MNNLKTTLLAVLLLPLTCFSQDIAGKWCANYRSGNNKGSFTDCVIIQQQVDHFDGLRWVESFCSECETIRERQGRTMMPLRYRADNSGGILKKMALKYHGGELTDENPDPSGDDIVFTREEKLTIPSFNCAKARQPREQAICSSASLSLLDKELSLVFDAAKACDPNGKINVQQNTWWKDELSKCQSGDCVPEVYFLRIAALRKICK